MKKRDIKIIKREAEDASPPAPTIEEILIRQEKAEADGERDMTVAVKTWISERRENNQAEEIDAGNRLFAWDPFDPTEHI